MPENSAQVKKENVRRFGATIRFCAPNVPAREALLKEVLGETGATVIHPFDDERVIAGQATVALELLEAHPDLDVVIAPIGGGGLVSGTAIAARSLKPSIRVYGAEPKNADDAARSLRTGLVEPLAPATTICDGPAHDAIAAHACRAIRAPRGGPRHREREAIVQGDADDVGADEDRDRAVVFGSARMPARKDAGRRRRERGRDPVRRQRRPRSLPWQT
jgi:hypothetical protein